MKLDDLIMQSKLVDKNTKEIVGYTLLSTSGGILALTRGAIESLEMDLINYLDYTDPDEVEVISYKGYYSPVENILYRMEEYSDNPYKVFSDGKVAIYGDVVERFKLINLDNKTAIRNILEEND